MTPQLPGVAFICIYVHIKPGGSTCRGADGESTCFDMHSEKTTACFLWSGAARINPHVHYYTDRPPPRGRRKHGSELTEGWRRRTGRALRWSFTVLDPLTAHSTLPAQQRIRAKPRTSQLPSPKQPANIAHAHTHIHMEHNHKTSV